MPIELDAGYRLQRLMDRLRRMQSVRPVDALARREFFTLHVLRKMCLKKGGGVQMSALAREMEVSLPAISKTVQTLEERGYALREADPTSRRNTLVRPTEAGMALEEELDRENALQTRRVFEKLGEEDTAAFFRVFERLVQIVEQDAEEAMKKREERSDD